MIIKERFKNRYLYNEYRGSFNGVYHINTFEKALD
jgi:hypothetical protein